MHIFSTIFGKEIYMFRTDLLSTIRSLDTVFTATDICHTIYVDCLLARSGSILTSLADSQHWPHQQTVCLTTVLSTNCCEYSIKIPDDERYVFPKQS